MESEQSGRRLSFKVTSSDTSSGEDQVWFVRYKDGSKWQDVGMIVNRPIGKFLVKTKGSKYNVNERPFKSFDWFLKKVVNDRPLPDFVKVYHAGQCANCGRQLTDPESIRSGFGPTCRKTLNI